MSGLSFAYSADLAATSGYAAQMYPRASRSVMSLRNSFWLQSVFMTPSPTSAETTFASLAPSGAMAISPPLSDRCPMLARRASASPTASLCGPCSPGSKRHCTPSSSMAFDAMNIIFWRRSLPLTGAWPSASTISTANFWT